MMMAVDALAVERARAPEAAKQLSLGTLEHSAGFVMRIGQLTVFERLFAFLGESDIRISEFAVLYAIAENPGIRQGVLADVLKIKWPNMTKLVRALEDRGLIERHIPPSDRRSVRLTVTKQGRVKIAASEQKMARADRFALSMLDDAEHALLLKLSRKIAGWPPMRNGE